MSFRKMAQQSANISPDLHPSCIPCIAKKTDPFGYAKEVIRRHIAMDREVDLIIIIDPYISSLDIYLLSELYGGYCDLSMKVISKFETIDAQESKEVRKASIQSAASLLCQNSLFKQITFIHSTEQMHDRYVISCSGNKMRKVFSIGGSVSQRFGKNTSIIELTDLRIIHHIAILIKNLESNTCEIF